MQNNYIVVVSNEGNKVHAYSLIDFELKHCLFRGNSLTKTLNISFSKKGKFMAMISSRETLHIFSLEKDHEDQKCLCDNESENSEFETEDSKSGFFGFFSKIKVIDYTLTIGFVF